MDAIEAIEKAGGPTTIVNACLNRGLKVTRDQVAAWKVRNTFPKSEWTGETSVVGVICELIKAMGHDEVHPLDLCPGAGQYMDQPDSEAA